jgi:hypothetical protein
MGRLRKFAKCVLLNMKLSIRAFQDFVTLIAKCVITAATVQQLSHTSRITIDPAGKADVYNLEVEDVHCFSINGGAIVHNCRYGIVSLMNLPRGGQYHPNVSAYERIFGKKDDIELPVSHLPNTGRSGYG